MILVIIQAIQYVKSRIYAPQPAANHVMAPRVALVKDTAGHKVEAPFPNCCDFAAASQSLVSAAAESGPGYLEGPEGSELLDPDRQFHPNST